MEGGFLLLSFTNESSRRRLLSRLFIIWSLVTRRLCALGSLFIYLFFYTSLFLEPAIQPRVHQCPILRVTSTSLRAPLRFIRVRHTGPRLWLPRGTKTWPGRRPDQPSALIPDRLLSPPRPVPASPARCHIPQTQPEDFHHTW